jgi:hypothetical protein
MGFTIYWHSTPVDTATWKTFSNFIKTMVGPNDILAEYDTTSVLLEAVKGPAETFFVAQAHSGYHFCKTNRIIPFTREVMKTVIMMKEFGLAEDINSDDNAMFLEVLEWMQEKARPLKCYEDLKKKFTK